MVLSLLAVVALVFFAGSRLKKLACFPFLQDCCFKFYLKVQKRNVFGDKRVVVGGMGRERKAIIKVVVPSLLMVGRAIANVQMEQ